MDKASGQPGKANGAWRRAPTAGGVETVTVYGLVLSEREVTEFLVRSADEYAQEMCEDNPCEVCDGFCALWHDLYSDLSATYRLVVEEMLSGLGIGAPRPRQGGF